MWHGKMIEATRSRIISTAKMAAKRSSGTSGLKEPHGIKFQMTAFFRITAVKTSNLT
jgi:hypothetical protein